MLDLREYSVITWFEWVVGVKEVATVLGRGPITEGTAAIHRGDLFIILGQARLDTKWDPWRHQINIY